MRAVNIAAATATFDDLITNLHKQKTGNFCILAMTRCALRYPHGLLQQDLSDES